MKRLQALLERRNRKVKVRVATKVPYGTKRERLAEKRHQAEKKSQRSGGGEED